MIFAQRLRAYLIRLSSYLLSSTLQQTHRIATDDNQKMWISYSRAKTLNKKIQAFKQMLVFVLFESYRPK